VTTEPAAIAADLSKGAPRSAPRDEATPAITFAGVSKCFADVKAVDDVSLTIRAGEMFSLLGASGSGKTTLLRLLAGFETPDEGKILIHGRDVTDLPPHQRPVNLMFQHYALFPHLSVANNIAYGLRRLPKDQRPDAAGRRERVQEVLDLVQLSGVGHRRPHQLSGGQRQRVALARALVLRPKILLLDEPLGALDRKLRERTQLELIRIQDETGITFVIVTHDQDEALSLSDRIAVLRDGAIAQVGPPRQLYDRPAHSYVADFIGLVNLLELGEAGSQPGTRRLQQIGQDVPVRDDPLAATARFLAIRPERLSVLEPGDDVPEGHAALTAEVRDVTFLGDQILVRVAVACPDGSETIMRVAAPARGPDAVDPDAGTEVQVIWPVSAGQLLED